MNRADRDLLEYSSGSYSTSDWGCAGDVIGIAPRIFPTPSFVTEFLGWQAALQEEVDACVLQNGVCWILKPDQIAPRFGQESDGGCPGCRGPGPTGFAGITATTQQTRQRQGIPMRANVRGWKPTGVVTPEGVAAIKNGAVLPLWRRIFKVSPPERLVMAPAGLDYRSAVRGAMYLSTHTGRPMVVGGEANGKTIPMLYVQPGGIVRGVDGELAPVNGWETDTYSMDPFEVRQAYAASRGGLIMPWNAVGG